MTRKQFKILARLLIILIKVTLWKKDPAGKLYAELCKIAKEV